MARPDPRGRGNEAGADAGDVALIRSRDLLLRAKYLLVAAIVAQGH
jgi:hypothetical protein